MLKQLAKSFVSISFFTGFYKQTIIFLNTFQMFITPLNMF